MRRLLVLLLTVVVAWLGWLPPAAAAAPLSLAAIATHSYDAPAIPTSLVGARVQRGPPTATYDYTAHDAVDRWSPGASARSGDATPPAIYNYDDTARFVRTTLGSHGVVWRASVDGTGVDVVQLTSVAAETAGETSSLLERTVANARDWLGPGGRVITNDAGDKIFLSEDGLRRIRVDINRPYPHEFGHAHLEELIDGKWVRSGPIYPSDVPAR